MSLVQVSIVMAVSTLFGIAFAFIAEIHGLNVWWKAAVLMTAGVLAIELCWRIALRFKIPPLMALAGPCPACGTRPPGWWCDGHDAGVLKLRCGACEQPVELWLLRKPPVGRVSASVPSFALRWPEYFGVWRRLAAAPADPRA
jgi:hypothetical protein